ncbi:MAG: hypothetical protein LAT55_10935 [Opitutales bacterium]|nr:hypothetical protein [Opitutales bacterium]
MKKKSVRYLLVSILLVGGGGGWLFLKIQEKMAERSLQNFIADWQGEEAVPVDLEKFIRELNETIAQQSGNRSAHFAELTQTLAEHKEKTEYYEAFEEEELSAWTKEHWSTLLRYRDQVMALQELPQGISFRKELTSPWFTAYHESALYYHYRTATRAFLQAWLHALEEGKHEEASGFIEAALFAINDLAEPACGLSWFTRLANEAMIFYSLLDRAEGVMRERKNAPLQKHLKNRFRSRLQPEPEFFYHSFLLYWAMNEELRQLPPTEKPAEDIFSFPRETQRVLKKLSNRQWARHQLLTAKEKKAFAEIASAAWDKKYPLAQEYDVAWPDWTRGRKIDSLARTQPPFARLVEMELAHEIILRMLLTGLALGEFCDTHGHFPDQLEDMVNDQPKPPEWMIHPESGELLSYEPQEDGFVLSGIPSFPLREVDPPLRIEFRNDPGKPPEP